MDYNSGHIYFKKISDSLDSNQIEELITEKLNFKMSEIYYMSSNEDIEIIDLDN